MSHMAEQWLNKRASERVPVMGQNRVELSERIVRDLQPQSTRRVLWDSKVRGFGLRISPSGSKVWFLAYRMPGERTMRNIALGPWPGLKATEARALAEKRRGDVAHGVNPTEQRRQTKPTAPADTGLTVQQAVTKWLDKRAASPRYLKECRAMLARDIAPAVGMLPLASLTRDNVEDLYRSVAARGPFMANRVYALLRAVCRRAVEDELLVRNPCRLSAKERHREPAKERMLTAQEQARFLAALDNAARIGLPQPPAQRRRRKRPPQPAKPRTRKGGRFQPGVMPADPYAVAAVKLLLLTGMRLREALGLRWSEVDPDKRLLRLERSKTGRSVRPLGQAALALLNDVRTLPRRAGTEVFVFASSQERAPHLQSVAALWNAVKHAAELEKEKPVRLHDLRHTFASNMLAAGATLAEVAAALGQSLLQTAARYTHVSSEAARAAVDRATAQNAA